MFKPAYAGLITIAVTAIAIAVAGCHNPNSAEPPYYKYTIDVAGLEHFYTDTGFAHIGLPVPEHDGSALLPFSGIVTIDLSEFLLEKLEQRQAQHYRDRPGLREPEQAERLPDVWLVPALTR